MAVYVTEFVTPLSPAETTYGRHHLAAPPSSDEQLVDCVRTHRRRASRRRALHCGPPRRIARRWPPPCPPLFHAWAAVGRPRGTGAARFGSRDRYL